MSGAYSMHVTSLMDDMNYIASVVVCGVLTHCVTKIIFPNHVMS